MAVTMIMNINVIPTVRVMAVSKTMVMGMYGRMDQEDAQRLYNCEKIVDSCETPASPAKRDTLPGKHEYA